MIIVPQPSAAPDGSDAPVRPRVVVVCGQPLLREALGSLVAQPPLLAVAVLTAGPEEARHTLAEMTADLILCDLRVEPVSPRPFLASLAELGQAPPTILLADPEDESELVDHIDSEAAGLFTKDTEPEQFLDGAVAVLAGHRAIGDNVLRRLIARLSGDDTGSRPRIDQLSPTELDILAMVGSAATVDQIARARGISPKTVRNHLASIYRKLELRSRTEAMLCAARLGLVPG